DGAHRAEVFRGHFAPDELSHFVHQVDDVDAVDLQILVQTSVERDFRRFELEQLAQRRADTLQNFVLRKHEYSSLGIGRARRSATRYRDARMLSECQARLRVLLSRDACSTVRQT